MEAAPGGLKGLWRQRTALAQRLMADGKTAEEAALTAWRCLRERLLAEGRADMAAALYQEHLGAARQAAGIFYTPRYLSDYLAAVTLAPLSGQPGVRVLDPACGAGSFLAAARAHAPAEGLYGLDLDSEALALAAALLGEPGPHLRCADALTCFPADPPWQPGFDAVLGNPPWGADLSDVASELEQRYSLARDQYDSYALFIELATRLLRPGGRLGFVVPQSLLSQPNYGALRRHLLDHYRLDQLINLGDGIFRRVYQPCMLLVATRAPAGAPGRVHVVPGLSQKDRRLVGSGQTDLAALVAKRGFLVESARFHRNPASVFDIYATDPEAALLARLEVQRCSWDDHVEMGRGVEIGKGGEVIRCPHCRRWNNVPLVESGGRYRTKRCTSCRRFISPDAWHPGNPDTYQVIVHDHPVPGAVPFLPGEAVGRWQLGPTRWIRLGFSGIQYKDPAFYRGPKIVVRKTGAGLTATLDMQDHYTSQVVFILRPVPRSPLAPEYILGLLNSRLNLWYYHRRLQDAGRNTFPYVTQSVIKSLLLREATPAEQAPIVAAVRAALAGGAPPPELDETVARLFGLKPGELPWETRTGENVGLG